MTIALDWQLELPARSLLVGPATVYDVLSKPVYPRGFIGDADLRTSDSPNLGHGDSFGNDFYTSRLMQLTIGTKGATDVLARQQLDALRVAWRAVAPSDDLVQMDVRLPGAPETLLSYFGRPRQVQGKGDLYVSGWLAADLEFHAEPYAYGALRTLENQSGTFTIPAADTGHVGTRSARVLITIDANGGTPSIVNETDQDRDITFVAGVAVDTDLDLRTQTAVQGATSVIGQVSHASWWFELVGGVDNVITVSGCTGIDISWRPAYY